MDGFPPPPPPPPQPPHPPQTPLQTTFSPASLQALLNLYRQQQQNAMHSQQRTMSQGQYNMQPGATAGYPPQPLLNVFRPPPPPPPEKPAIPTQKVESIIIPPEVKAKFPVDSNIIRKYLQSKNIKITDSAVDALAYALHIRMRHFVVQSVRNSKERRNTLTNSQKFSINHPVARLAALAAEKEIIQNGLRPTSEETTTPFDQLRFQAAVGVSTKDKQWEPLLSHIDAEAPADNQAIEELLPKRDAAQGVTSSDVYEMIQRDAFITFPHKRLYMIQKAAHLDN